MAKRGKKLDDGLREEIRAYYASCGNLSETAKKFGISRSTVRKLRDEKPDEMTKLRHQKKSEHIEKAWSTINAYLIRVNDPELIQKTNARDSAIVIGTLWDKVNKEKEIKLKGIETELREKELTPSELELEEKRLKNEKLKLEIEKIKNLDDTEPIEIIIKRKGEDNGEGS